MLHEISKSVKKNDADIGFGFDGDGDRVGVIDNEGKEIFSDKARNEIINRISGLEGWKIMATPERFEKSFPKESRDLWRKEIQKAGIDLVRVGRHRVELFRASKSSLKWIMAKPKWLFGL